MSATRRALLSSAEMRLSLTSGTNSLIEQDNNYIDLHQVQTIKYNIS